VTNHSGIVPTDSGIVTSDSGQSLKLGAMDRNTHRAICRRRQIHFFITWQMLGQRFARKR
jgi:hypothetical protein